VEDHYRKLERMYHKAPTNEYYQPLLEVGEGIPRLSLAVRKDFFYAAGAVHGSVYFKALDDAAFFAASSVADNVMLLTTSFTVYLIRPVTDGQLVCRGRLVSRTRTLLIAESVLELEGGPEVARGTGTFMPSRVKPEPGIGYC